MADEFANDFSLETHKVFNTNVIELRGTLTSRAEIEVKSACRAASEGGATVLIDLSRVSSLDLSGVGLMIMAVMDTRKQGGKVLVSGIAPAYKKVFDLVRFSSLAPMFDTEERALGSIQ